MDKRWGLAQGDPQTSWAPDQAGPSTGTPGEPRTEGRAVGALVCAIANLFLYIFVPAIVALVLATQAARRIKRSGGALTGTRLVTAARVIAVVALVLNTLAAVAGVIALVDRARDAGDTATAAEALAQELGEGSVFLLQPGDCFLEPTQAEQVSTVQPVDCAEPHDAEVFHNIDLPDGAFPGDTAVTAIAERDCATAFEGYVGTPFEDSALDIWFLRPNADSWSKGDRQINCLISSPDGSSLRGSVKGSNR